ncbi:fibronectin-binding domain-containing protein [Candidatus Bathyarchaeota archaeon]|nr:MAG: fibronectin-binding domain-containing protein [Candidatus Bathyarchaeota archaeon]
MSFITCKQLKGKDAKSSAGKNLHKEPTSFDIAAVTAELNKVVRIGDARINNVYQINPKTIILKIKNPGAQAFNLLVEAGKRMHLTSYQIEKPLKPPPFCMALRKYLRNGIINEISQHEFERIAKIGVKTKFGDFKLIIELFGDGNIILVDPENRILHAMTYKRMRDRNVIRGEEFKYPPPSGMNPLKSSKEDFEKIREMGEIEVVKALTRFFSIGGIYAEETLLRAEVPKNTSCKELKLEELDRIREELIRMVLQVKSGKLEPAIVIDKKGEPIDAIPISLKTYEKYKHKTFESFNEALDEFYIKKSLEEKEEKTSEKIEKQLKKMQRRLKSQEEAVEKIKEEIERKKRIGNLIYLHFHELQTLFQRIEEIRKRGGNWVEKVKAISFPKVSIQKIDSKKMLVTIKIDEEELLLNLRHSIQENAAKYYSESKKAEKKLKGALEAIKETKKRIEELKMGLSKALAEEKTRIKVPAKVRRKAWYERFRWFHSSEGFLVLGGKDATTNELLIKKYMDPEDIVFHADIAGAPFVIIKTGGKKPSEKTIMEAAQFAASFSKAWKMGLGSLDVYWVKPEQVSKSAPPGQFLKKGAFVIRGKKNYVRHVPLRTAVGITFKNGQPLIIGGPTEAISNQTGIYIEIVPGDTSSGRLAKQIVKTLIEKFTKKARKRILKIPIDEVQSFIPSGKGRILKK